MSSSSVPQDLARRGHIRRAIRRITTTFRRADGHSGDFTANDLPGPVSPLTSGAGDMHFEDTWPTSRDSANTGSPHDREEFRLAATNTADAMLADTNDAMLANTNAGSHHRASLDPSVVVPGAVLSGEWTMDRDDAHISRVQRLRSRYGVEMRSHDRLSHNQPSVVHRVQRAPRMRVHRACHLCGIEFDHNRKCTACSHDICKRCPRSEGRRTRALQAGERQSTYNNQDREVAATDSTERRQLREAAHLEPTLHMSDAGLPQHKEGRELPLLSQGTPQHSGPNSGASSSVLLADANVEEDGQRIHAGKGELTASDTEDHIAFKQKATRPSTILTESIRHIGESSAAPAPCTWTGPVTLLTGTSASSTARSRRDTHMLLEVNPGCLVEARSDALPRPDGVNLDRGGTSESPNSQTLTSRAEHRSSNPLQAQTMFDPLLLPHVDVGSTHSLPLVHQARSRSSIYYLPLSAAKPVQESLGLECGLINQGPTKAFSTVQRVFRKPRQRIRYICHQCSLPLLHTQTCSKCGHHRCEHCRRRP